MIHIVGSCNPSVWEKFIGFFPDESVIVFDDVWYTDTRPLYLILQEPDIICPYHTDETIRMIDKYVHVYTFNEKLLTMFPEKTTRYLGNYATVEPFEDKKIFKISGWASTKIYNDAPGHHLRLEIYNRQLELSNCTFFRSINRNIGTSLPEVIEGKNPFLGEDFIGGGKKCLFEGFQFSIVLENSQQKNYFTEKIIDCLITKTIPIYWGCPNISEFFDTTGWLFFHNFESLLEIINNLDETYYEKFLDVINKNFYSAFDKKDFFDNITIRCSK
jgi:hypothetical protein